MKKTIFIFMMVLIESYLILSFFIPSLTIGIITTPLNYFIANLTSAWLFKIIISVLISALITIISKKNIKTKKAETIMRLILIVAFIIIFVKVINSCFMAHLF